MKFREMYFILLACFIYSCSSDGDSTTPDTPISLPPAEEDPVEMMEEPDPTDGFSSTQVNFLTAQGFPPLTENWELVNELTDEFSGESLDLTKWNDVHPVWAGRAPSNFLRENTTASDGFLRLKSTSRVDDLSEVADPMVDIWVNAASMTSKSALAQPGYYYEASIKASDISMTSSFWFRIGQFSEIDVIEHTGRSTDTAREDRFAFQYGANTHTYGPLPASENPNEYTMPTRGRDAFHTYGVWWKSPRELLFYYDGEQVMDIVPQADFDENLFLIFDTEVFTFRGLPTIESLKDDSRNTMMVDFVRSYRPADTVFSSGLLQNGSFENNGTENWLWQGDVSLNGETSNLNEGVLNVNLKDGGSIIQRVAVSANTSYVLSYNVRSDQGDITTEVMDIASSMTDESDWSSKTIGFNSGDRTEIFIKITSSAGSSTFIDGLSLIAE